MQGLLPAQRLPSKAQVCACRDSSELGHTQHSKHCILGECSERIWPKQLSVQRAHSTQSCISRFLAPPMQLAHPSLKKVLQKSLSKPLSELPAGQQQAGQEPQCCFSWSSFSSAPKTPPRGAPPALCEETAPGCALRMLQQLIPLKGIWG